MLCLLSGGSRALANPSVTPGGSASFPVLGYTGMAASGWAITLNGTTVATTAAPAGWTVTTGSQFTVGAPSTATIATNYEVIYNAGGGYGPYAYFDVAAAQLTPISLSVSPGAVVGTTSSTGTVTISAAAPTGGQAVSLSSDTTSAATVPSSVTVAAGATTATFTITTNAVNVGVTVTISAASGGVTKTASLGVEAALSVSVSPISTVGGIAVTGTVTLTDPAPNGGAVVSISSSNTGAATVPATVTLPAASSSNTFAVSTTVVTTSTVVTLSASYFGSTVTTTLTVNPWLKTFTLNPAVVVGGNASTGSVVLNAAAPAGGLPVAISNDTPGTVTAPSTLTVPQGQSSATFNATTSVVTAPVTATLQASYQGLSLSQQLTVQPLLSSLSLNPSAVTGGSSSTALVQLNGPAPAGGISVVLSSGSGAATVPASLAIAAGASSGTFSVTTGAVTTVTNASISAAYGGVTASSTLTINPIRVTVTLNPVTVIGGSPSTGTVTLNGPAPAGGLTVTLSSSNSAAATVPGSVTVAAAATTATFTVTTLVVATPTYPAVTGSYGGLNSSATLTVQPLLSSLTLSPTTVVGGSPSTGTVTLNAPAPGGGTTVTLSSSNTAAATVPGNVTVSAGNTTATFTVTTLAVTANTTVTMTAANAGASATASLTVQPLLSSLRMNPSSTYSGGVSTGTVTLNGPAPTGGVSVTLASTDTNAAPVPASVNVAAGSTSATFTVTAGTVTASTTATITAAYAGASNTARLTVQPLLSSLSLNPSTIIGGGTSTGTVTLNGPAPTGGVTVTLSSGSTTVATVPASVNVVAGATSATFTATGANVTVSSTSTLSASYAGVTATAILTVTPLLSSLRLNPSSLVGLDASTATLNFSVAAPAGVTIQLSSSNTAVATVPATANPAAGSMNTTFTVSTSTVTAAQPVTISATYSGVTVSATLTVNPMPTVQSLAIDASPVVGGASPSATVTLSGIAPLAGATVTLTSANSAVASVPASVVVSGGQTSATFTVTTVPVAADATVSISGSFNSSSASYSLIVMHPAFNTFSVTPGTVIGGNGLTASLGIAGPAPPGGVTINLSSSVSGSVSMPASVTIPAGASSATVPIATSTVNRPISVTITAQNAAFSSETLTATVAFVVGNLYTSDINVPKELDLSWNVPAIGHYVLTRDGATLATLANNINTYQDVFNFTSGQTYTYSIYDNNTTPATLLSVEKAVPYFQPAVQDQAVDSRLDTRYATNVFLNFQFGSKAYKGGLFVGYASDPAKIGRSFAQFSLSSPPAGTIYRTGKVCAYLETSATIGGSATEQVGCQTINNNTWSAPTLNWSNAPAVTPASATQTVSITYNPANNPPVAAGWYTWRLADDIQAAAQAGALYSAAWASMDETTAGWVYFAKSEFDSTVPPSVVHLWSVPVLVSIQAPTPINLGGQNSANATGAINVNAIGLQGSAVVSLSCDNANVVVPASVTVTGLNRTFAIAVNRGNGTPYTATITATYAGTSVTTVMNVTP